MIKQALTKIADRQHLTRAEMISVMNEIMEAVATPAQIGAFLTGLRMKGETVEEIAGAAEVVRSKLQPIRVDKAVFVDTCGTGGDGRNTFNISTASAFVVAAAGVPVAKHGNRSVSSRCGSADVLTALGVNIDIPFPAIEQCIADIGIGFLFAPRHHPTFKAVAEIRRELGVRTIFNLLGPLANPARARHQVMGVYDSAWVPVIANVLNALGALHAFVVHGDGLDEITVTGSTRICEVKDGAVREYSVQPEEIGLRRWKIEELVGGDPVVNSKIIRDALDGQKGAPHDAVVANAAAALVCGGLARDLSDGVQHAEQAIQSGAASRKLAALIAATGDV